MSTMTLISDDGYDVVVENYQLVGVTGPTMNISGADEDFNDLTDGTTQFSDGSTDFYTSIPITAGTNPDTIGVSGTIKFHSPFVFSVDTGSKGTDQAPTVSAITNGGNTLAASTTSLVVVPDAANSVTVDDRQWSHSFRYDD